jgi:glyoxylase I family protein
MTPARTAAARLPEEVVTPAGPGFAGIDHVALTVTDLDVSERFYTEVLGFVVVMDVGTGRICMHPATGFVLALLVHDGGTGRTFSELNVGADHLGLASASRDELEWWQARFDDLGVRYTPIRDETFGSHLNFRDPDDIALELSCSNELMTAAQAAMATGRMSADDIARFIAENVDEAYAVRNRSASDG